MLARFADPAVLARAFARVEAKERARDSLEPFAEGGPPLATVGAETPRLIRTLAPLIAHGRYVFAPVEPRTILVGGRARLVFHARPLDVVVATAVADVLSEALDGALSPRVFSYRRGRSPKRALLELAAFVRSHVRERPDPRQRGLYVVRRDVRGYGDSIPSGPTSRLWRLLRDALDAAGLAHDDAGFRWLVAAIRPALAAGSSPGLSPDVGIPTGSPLQPLMANLYLRELDDELAALAGGFYARFGDDMLFAHPAPDVAQSAARTLDQGLAERGLGLGADKCSERYLTAAGRPSEAAPAFAPCSSFTYLGMRMDGHGQVGLANDKVTRFLRDVALRLRRSHALTRELDPDERLRTLCQVANAAWDVASPTHERGAELLRDVVTCRSQLKDLDHQLALRVAEVATGQRGVRAFRALPPRTLRACGLGSLVHARNRRAAEAP